jgi:hypothetical protein
MKQPKRGKKKSSPASPSSSLDQLYQVLEQNDYLKVLALGQEQLATSEDKLAVLEAMIDALENLLYEGEVENPAPLKALEHSLRTERQRMTESGAKSDRYKKFLDRSYDAE